MSLNYLFLSLTFILAGLLGLVYYNYLPNRQVLQQRLRRSIPISLMILAIIGAAIWYLIENFEGYYLMTNITALMYTLFLFETFFVLLLKWIKSNYLAFVSSLLISSVVIYLHYQLNNFLIFNIILIAAFIGLAAFLSRLEFLRTWLIMAIAGVFMVFDLFYVNYLFPTFTRAAEDPSPVFLLPAVTIQGISLGGGDFVFLFLFSFLLVRQFGVKPALIHVFLQGIGLLLTSYYVTQTDTVFPFLTVLVPNFFLNYFVFWQLKKQRATT